MNNCQQYCPKFNTQTDTYGWYLNLSNALYNVIRLRINYPW